jgi:glucan-binding YG repeat protein
VGSACVYYFGEDGKLIKGEGIVDIDGTLYYFDDYRLAWGAGLVEVEAGKYIYVTFTGELAVGEYWVSADKTNGLPVKGGETYIFDENGYLTNPIDAGKNGIIDGYYYVDGKAYYAGLIEIDGDIYYINSQGKVITGWYYVTKTNGYDFGTTKLFFDEEGKMQEITWSKADEFARLKFFAADGSELVINRGKTYIAVNYSDRITLTQE